MLQHDITCNVTLPPLKPQKGNHYIVLCHKVRFVRLFWVEKSARTLAFISTSNMSCRE